MDGTFAYSKAWGAELLGGGLARFRVWAPGADLLSVVGAKGQDIAMSPGDYGWFEAQTDAFEPGDSYGFRLADGMVVPDPAARAQTGDVHGLSKLIDPNAFAWQQKDWQGRPWEEAVIYELHAGTFSQQGNFAGIARQLDHLAETGFTAIEIMPVAQFGGNRGWGYDGVLLYAPHIAYGGPEGLKALVDAAHARGLMVLLDTVYNHFGPDGNYLHLYAPEFFDPARQTPWGAGIAYDQAPVRDFFVDNALYWLEEYQLDGLRLDAINQIKDPSSEHLLETLAYAIRDRFTSRHIHLTTEDDRNITRLHERGADGTAVLYTGEWNDDIHHAAHVIATGETEGYYTDYAERPVEKLARGLAEGFIFQGEISPHLDKKPRGVPSTHQPPTAFVDFIQNHDQVGNRAFAERLTDLAPAAAVEALMAVLLLSPHIPLVFMGEEWGETNGFAFFTDFEGDLADAVREGRRREFAGFSRFADEANRAKIPDPNAPGTFEASKLNWPRRNEPGHRERLALTRRLLAIRHADIVPRLKGAGGHCGAAKTKDGRALGVHWKLAGGSALTLIANLSSEPCNAPMLTRGRVLFESEPGLVRKADSRPMPAWSVAAVLDDGSPTA